MSTPAAKLAIRDREGVLPVSIMRDYFERAMRDTEQFRDQPLEIQSGNQFAYESEETDILWTGFALGMRCAERIQKARE